MRYLSTIPTLLRNVRASVKDPSACDETVFLSQTKTTIIRESDKQRGDDGHMCHKG